MYRWRWLHMVCKPLLLGRFRGGQKSLDSFGSKQLPDARANDEAFLHVTAHTSLSGSGWVYILIGIAAMFLQDFAQVRVGVCCDDLLSPL